MSTTTRPTESSTDVAAKNEGLARPDISLIDDGHEYESYNPSSWLRKAVFGLVVIGALVSGSWAAVHFLMPEAGPAKTLPTHTVAAADLLIEVTESGTLESAVNLDIKCEIAGGTTILWIIEDGAQVEKGAELVRLDDAALREEVTQQEIIVERARSTEIQAEKNVEVAKINVREYEEGTFVQEKQTLESQIVVAEENLRSAKNALQHTERMFRKGYATQLELEAQKFAVRRGELDLASAETAKTVLVDFTKEKMLEDLKSQVATAEATFSSEQKALELEEMKLERLKTQLSKCVIKAPKGGMVVYANEKSRRGGDDTQISEGAAVREQQTILRLPDLSQMQVKVGVHEAKVDTIELGMPAIVRVLGQDLRGSVTSIGNQPAQSGNWFSTSVKKYDTTITIDNSSRGEMELKPGMTAEAKILVEDLKEQIAVPTAAIYEGYVWVQNSSGEFERREVTTGVKNDRLVAIEKGLQVGDVIALNTTSFQEEIAKIARNRPQLSAEERYGSRGRGGPEAGSPGGNGPGGGPGGGPVGGRGKSGAADMFSGMDANQDGFIGRDEAPEQLASRFDDLDTNKDDKISKSEMDAAMKAFSAIQEKQ